MRVRGDEGGSGITPQTLRPLLIPTSFLLDSRPTPSPCPTFTLRYETTKFGSVNIDRMKGIVSYTFMIIVLLGRCPLEGSRTPGVLIVVVEDISEGKGELQTRVVQSGSQPPSRFLRRSYTVSVSRVQTPDEALT